MEYISVLEHNQNSQKLSEYFKFLSFYNHKNKSTLDNSESSRHVKVLEKLLPRNLDKDYIKKICLLLKKKDKNHSKKRMNLDQTNLGFDENDNLYLTLTKFEHNENEEENSNNGRVIRKKELLIQERKENLIKQNRRKSTVEEIAKKPLEDLIPEFYQHNQTKSDESDTEGFKLYDDSASEIELTEKEEKMLFEKLRTKIKFREEEYSNNNPTTRSHILIQDGLNKRSSNSQKKKIHKLQSSSVINSPIQYSTINTLNRNKSNPAIINKSLSIIPPLLDKYQTINPEKDNYKISPIIQNIKKMTKKIKILKNETSPTKEIKLDHITLFKYDKNKWQNVKLRESDKIIKHIEEFEARRKNMFKKMMAASYGSKQLMKKNSILRFSTRKSLEQII